MPDPHREPAVLTRRTAGRVLAATRQAEGHDHGNLNRTLPPRPHDQRGDRHVFPIRVTGQPDPATPYLWPAMVRYWSGYAAGVHSFENWPDDSVADIWAFVMPTSAGLETDGEYLATFVGIHTDGYAVFQVAGGSDLGPTTDVWMVVEVCPTKDEGVVTDIVRERRKVRIPNSWLIDDSECATNPADCCGSPNGAAASLTCGECDPAEIALPLAYLNFTSKTGVAVCLPDSLPLTRVPAVDSTSGFHTGGPPGWILRGASQTAGAYFGEADYCGGTYADCAHLWLTCGDTGPVVNYVGYATADGFVIGPLNGGVLSTADQACDVFDTPGTLLLGTLTHAGTLPGGASSSVVVTLSWE
jgi:hypothetical protein